MPSYLEQRILFYFTACFLLALAAQAFAQPSGQPVQPEISDSELRAKQNLTIDQYNRIYQRINSDEKLRQKVLRMVDEERKKSESR